MSRFQPNFFAILIILIIAGISISLPVIILSEMNKEALVGEGWVPDPTSTPTFTLTPYIPPTHTYTPEIDPSLLISPESEENSNCVYPLVYWEQNPDFWLELVMGEKIYSVDEVQRIFNNPSPDIFPELFRQVYLANLNIFSGADPASIRSTLDEANIWLQAYPLDNEFTFEAQQVILPIAQRLLDFNSGRTGPDFCSGYESAEVILVLKLPPTSTPTATNTPTLTATSVPTFTPSKTPTATDKPTKKPEKPDPPKPTEEPPTDVPPPPPTDPPPPPPTVAPPAPTDVPEKPTPTPAS